jgi:hypothetical protein
VVITQSGHGCGPRWDGMIDGHVDHRWLSCRVSFPKVSDEMSNAGGRSGLDWSHGWMYVTVRLPEGEAAAVNQLGGLEVDGVVEWHHDSDG